MKDKFDKAKDISQIISLVAVPVVLAVCGWLFQASLNDREIRRDYVQLALQIIRAEHAEKSDDLRDWAKQVLAAHSPVPFNDKQIADLDRFGVYVSPPAIPPLPNVARISQMPIPSICSQGCLKGYSERVDQMLDTLKGLESDLPAGTHHAH